MNDVTVLAMDLRLMGRFHQTGCVAVWQRQKG